MLLLLSLVVVLTISISVTQFPERKETGKIVLTER